MIIERYFQLSNITRKIKSKGFQNYVRRLNSFPTVRQSSFRAVVHISMYFYILKEISKYLVFLSCCSLKLVQESISEPLDTGVSR